MNRTGGLRARFAVFCSAILLAVAGCAGDVGTAPDGPTGSLSLDLTVAGAFEIDEVMWTIRGGDMPDMFGTIDTSAPGSSASVEVFGLPAGNGYTIEMEATSTDGELTCRGSGSFDIATGQVTDVHVMLNCKTPARFGAVRVDGTLNFCVELTKVVISPLQTAVGSRIDLQSEAVDEEGDTVAYRWTSESGRIDDPSAADTTYTCTEEGDDQLTITVSDDGFEYCTSEWTVPVTCVDGDPDPEVEFAYSEVTADGQAIRYLLDANDEGEMVGSVPSEPPGSLDGFVRAPDGSAQFWTTPDRLAYPTAINDEGRIVGTNIPIGGGLPEGFQRDAEGNETPYDFPGALGTVPFGISNDDTYTGFYVSADGRRGFVEQPSTGLSRSVEYPGATETQLYGVNNVGKAGGAHYDSEGTALPFIYDIESDSFEAITPPTSGNYVVTSINDAGDAIVFGLRDLSENYADLRSFYRDGDTGVMTELFYPGAAETYGYDIDNAGTIIGYFQDEAGGYGGFTAVVVP